MVMFDVGPPFQWKPKYKRFGDMRHFMWGWVAVITCPYNFNDFMEGIGRAGLEVYGDAERVKSHSDRT